MLLLPIEVIINICYYMNIGDIYSLITTCKKLYKLKKYVPILCRNYKNKIINLNNENTKKEREDILNYIVETISVNQFLNYKKFDGYFELYLKDINCTLFLCFENINNKLNYTQTIMNYNIEDKKNIINKIFNKKFYNFNEENINKIIGKIIHCSIYKYPEYILKINCICEIKSNFTIIDFTESNVLRIIKRNFDKKEFIIIQHGKCIKRKNPINNKLLIDIIYKTLPKNIDNVKIANEETLFYDININKIFISLYLNFDMFFKYYNNLTNIKNKKIMNKRKKRYI